jgi:4-hydroxymandelate oxidase
MNSRMDDPNRRRLLQWLAASPLLASSGFETFAAESSKLPDPMVWAPTSQQQLIKSPKEAINVFDFEPVARANVPPAHFGYMASGIDDEVTLRATAKASSNFSSVHDDCTTFRKST